MTKNKYYAVKSGRETGIFKTWRECEKQVKGFSGASYKGFPTLKEAEEFLNLPSGAKSEDLPFLDDVSKKPQADAVAYVDGSYNHSVKEFSYGVVMMYSGITDFFLGKSNDKDLVDMRNVAGEIMGAKEAMKFCIENNIKSLDIYHDYEV